VNVPDLDRATILEAVLPALQRDLHGVHFDDDATTASGRIVARGHGLLAGLPVAREVFARVGVRLRAALEDGDDVRPGVVVARVGGPLRAIGAARRTALRFLDGLSAVATGSGPARADGLPTPLIDYAVQIRSRGAESADNGGVRFDLVMET
jgi:nicotinate-nucleotide pyrophosphorylase (carboxylating)